MIGTSQKRNAFYLEAIQSLIKQGNTVNYVEVPEDLWLEIDFPSDFCAAKKKIEQIIG
jgi:choline kinase